MTNGHFEINATKPTAMTVAFCLVWAPIPDGKKNPLAVYKLNKSKKNNVKTMLKFYKNL